MQRVKSEEDSSGCLVLFQCFYWRNPLNQFLMIRFSDTDLLFKFSVQIVI